MAQYAWFFYALSAAVLWGFGYALSERVLKSGLKPSFFMLIEAINGQFSQPKTHLSTQAVLPSINQAIYCGYWC